MRYTPPDDYTPAVQREAHRAHRREKGEIVAEPKKTASTEVSPETLDALSAIAKSRDMSRHALIREILEQYVEKENAQ